MRAGLPAGATFGVTGARVSIHRRTSSAGTNSASGQLCSIPGLRPCSATPPSRSGLRSEPRASASGFPLAPNSAVKVPVRISSMKRISRPREAAYPISCGTSSLQVDRWRTAFSFTGARPADSAASMPASVSPTRAPRVRLEKRPASSESSETFTRASPASFSAPASRPNSEPLVVSETSRIPGVAARRSTSCSMPARTSGSPPVSFTRSIPSVAASHTANSARSWAGSNVAPPASPSPFAGMQYRQRKLHRSVSESRSRRGQGRGAAAPAPRGTAPQRTTSHGRTSGAAINQPSVPVRAR